MKKILTLVVFSLLMPCIPLIAQTPTFPWATGATGAGNDFGQGVGVDGSGNTYSTGFFQDSSITFGSTILTNNGLADVYVTKYDTSGNILWAKSAGGTNSDIAKGIAVHPSGVSFVTGSFRSASTHFDTVTLSNSHPGLEDVFVVKYDPDGNVVWARKGSGAGADYGYAIATDANENCYVVGYFDSPTLSFGGDTLTNVSPGTHDMFVVKYDSAGNVVWARRGGGPDIDYGTGVAVDELGYVFVTGDYASTSISFGAITLGNAGGYDAFLVKYDNSGNVVWANRAGGMDWDYGNGVAVDGSGNCYLAGNFNSANITFGSTTLTNAGPGSGDVYLAKYDVNGNVLWAKRSGGTNYDWRIGVASDPAGFCYVLGYFNSSTIAFDGHVLSNVSPGTGDVHVERYDPDGNVVGAARVGGASSDFGWGVAVDGSGNGYITGYYNSASMTFGSTTLHNPGASSDVYVAKISIPQAIAPSIASVTDVPNDQGGQVRIVWYKSSEDVAGLPAQVTSYSIWRRSASGSAANFKNDWSHTPQSSDSGVVGFDFVASVPAIQSYKYQMVVPTLEDSTSSGSHKFVFLIIAHNSGLNTYVVSAPDSGYSVDNLSPLPPAGLVATVEPGPQVHLTWDSPKDTDVKSYSIYRAVSPDFITAKIGTSGSTEFTDADPDTIDPSFYRIVAIDIHDNASQPSTPVSVRPTTTEAMSVRNRWNLVSVPLSVGDYSKTVLYPTATSHAFAYDGGYLAFATLKNATGYWMKFDGAQTVSLTGFFRISDTVDVVAGWNLIGSISVPLATSQLVSIPGGMTISKLFTYAGTYATADTIIPGNGYWVKVNQGGKIILSPSAPAATAGRVNILPTLEYPPKPPEDDASNLEPLPTSYALDQNFPNPFNPATTIRYSLPMDSDVRISVFNMLGEEVLTLVSEYQSAGFRSITFNADQLSSGMYVYRLTAGSFSEAKKFLLIK